ncbi:hypothetical protein PAPYR_11158 [Paratrimastix pyriformis]|uniref:Charged multivesicular body protein 7 n=1 Tax=Paratrimastix pyriformis TaxID=342808 RepID=A0ABQ8U4D6_9EUKA|nr:hypothetical protein PAPYR_11158 [Paratrimastix pyriformis]
MSDDSFLAEKVPEWSNDAQMSILFAPFPDDPTTVDPDTWKESWEPRVAFWKSLLVRYLVDHHMIVARKSDMTLTRFRRKGMVPLGLEFIFKELARSGEIVPLDVFQQACLSSLSGSAGWGSWVAQPLVWMFKRLTLTKKPAVPAPPPASPRRDRPPAILLHPGASVPGTPTRRTQATPGTPTSITTAASVSMTTSTSDEKLVCVPVVKEYAERLLEHYRQKQTTFTDLILTHAELNDQGWIPPTLPRLAPEDVPLVVMSLVRDHEATVVQIPGGADELGEAEIEQQAIRLSLAPGKAPRDPAPIDGQVAAVKRALCNLERRQANLLEQAQALGEKVRRLARQSRPLALVALRRQRAVMKVAEKEGGSLANLQDVLLHIQSAKGDQEVCRHSLS